MKQIALTQGKSAMVDDEDFQKVSEHRWLAHRSRNKSGELWYARRTFYDKNGRRKREALHSFILDTVCEVDHKDRDGLNCQRDNLRIADRSENQMNKITIPHTSVFKGVYWHRAGRRWAAEFSWRKQNNYLGLFYDERAAAIAYDKAVVERCGAFALTNQALGLL